MDISEVGKDIADDIEKNGHWQGERGVEGKRCVILSLPFARLSETDGELFKESLAKRVGLPSSLHAHIAKWNDSTGTEVVLKTLRDL